MHRKLELKDVLFAIPLFALLLALNFVRASDPWSKWIGLTYTPNVLGRSEFVTDPDNRLTKAEASTLNAELAAFKAETNIDLSFVLAAAPNGESFDSFSLALFLAHNPLNTKRSILFAVDPTAKLDRLEVGWGLIDDLPDTFVQLLLRESITPLLHDGKIFEGLHLLEACLRSRLGASPIPGVRAHRYVTSRNFHPWELAGISALMLVFLTGLIWAFRGLAGGALAAFVVVHPATPWDAPYLFPILAWCAFYLAWTVRRRGWLPDSPADVPKETTSP
jgi:uncharacterized membrane protein YgcG